jgi:hypothetical protein
MVWAEDYDLLLRADAVGMQMGKPEPILLRWREHDTRLTHTGTRYSHENFMQAKTHFLAHHRLKGRGVIIWGAGPTGQKIHDFLTEGVRQLSVSLTCTRAASVARNVVCRYGLWTSVRSRVYQ